ncbi:MAG: alpha/beta hydrolase, partial [Vicinamibacteria bacterium]
MQLKATRWFLIVVAGLGAAAAGFYAYKNPEVRALDAEARIGAPGAFVALPGGTVHFEVAGPETGRIAVLVHGFSVPDYIWDPTFKALSGAGYRVIRYDLFGRGLSDRPDAAYDGPFYDAQLNDLLDSLHITGPVDLFGLSFGGYVVAHYASTHPQRIRTLTLVDPVTSRSTLPWYIQTPVIGPYLFQVGAVPTMADNQASDFLHPERFPGWADRYRPQMQYRGFGRALRRSALTLTTADFESMYAAVAKASIPVLLIWGKQDHTLPIANAENVKQAIPGLEFFGVD